METLLAIIFSVLLAFPAGYLGWRFGLRSGQSGMSPPLQGVPIARDGSLRELLIVLLWFLVIAPLADLVDWARGTKSG